MGQRRRRGEGRLKKHESRELPVSNTSLNFFGLLRFRIAHRAKFYCVLLSLPRRVLRKW